MEFREKGGKKWGIREEIAEDNTLREAIHPPQFALFLVEQQKMIVRPQYTVI